MSDYRGLVRARFFLGAVLLAAAIMTWATALLMSPRGEVSADGLEHVRTTIVIFVRNTAIGTILLSALAGWLLFPFRRPKKPTRDWVIAGTLAVLVLTSIYQLIWLRSVVS